MIKLNEITKKVFIVAELSANHAGSLKIAIETIKAAKKAGADAIKLQTYTADTITIDSKKKDFIISAGSIWDGQNYYNLYDLLLNLFPRPSKSLIPPFYTFPILVFVVLEK